MSAYAVKHIEKCVEILWMYWEKKKKKAKLDKQQQQRH